MKEDQKYKIQETIQTIEDPLASQNATLARELYARYGEIQMKKKQLQQQIAALEEVELQVECEIVAISKRL